MLFVLPNNKSQFKSGFLNSKAEPVQDHLFRLPPDQEKHIFQRPDHISLAEL